MNPDWSGLTNDDMQVPSRFDKTLAKFKMRSSKLAL
jgi:hypothetical protein